VDAVVLAQRSPFFEIAPVLVRFDHIASVIVNANHGIMSAVEKLCMGVVRVDSFAANGGNRLGNAISISRLRKFCLSTWSAPSSVFIAQHNRVVHGPPGP
jgi:hypothetical protein